MKKAKLAVFIAATICVGAYALRKNLVVSSHTVITDKIIPAQKVRIAIVSDLHSFGYPDSQGGLLNTISKQAPDIIALTGDIVDDKAPLEGAFLFARKVTQIAPAYYVTGNHEYLREDVSKIKKTFRSFGIRVLENEYERININGAEMIIAGAEDPAAVGYDEEYKWERCVIDSFKSLRDEDCFKVLLSHKPHMLGTYMKLPFDLILCGHTHGGQIKLPFTKRGLYASGQGFFPKYYSGRYDHDGFVQIISNGVSIQPHIPRIFNPPEITIVDIIGAPAGV